MSRLKLQPARILGAASLVPVVGQSAIEVRFPRDVARCIRGEPRAAAIRIYLPGDDAIIAAHRNIVPYGDRCADFRRALLLHHQRAALAVHFHPGVDAAGPDRSEHRAASMRSQIPLDQTVRGLRRRGGNGDQGKKGRR
jgi:hypothetical protein